MTIDPYLWLEDVDGAESLEWARARNAETAQTLHTARQIELRDGILEVLDSDDRIPYVIRRGEFLYNFWKDAEHPRGLWRRTTLAEYRTRNPAWEVLIDVDALGAAEGVNWVWAGAQVLRPDHDRALVSLSRGGADAVEVREFDLLTRVFSRDGFTLPEAKQNVQWIDRDSVYVGTDFGDGSLTTSGYPRIAKKWLRGTPISAAEFVFEGKVEDVSAGVSYDDTPGFERTFAYRSPDFFTTEEFLVNANGSLTKLEVPDDAETSVHRNWLLVRLVSDWFVLSDDQASTYLAGSLLAIDFEDFLVGGRKFFQLFVPDEHTSLEAYTWTRNHLLLTVLKDVVSRIDILSPGPGTWAAETFPGSPELGTISIVGTNPLEDDEFFFDTSGYLQPSTYSRAAVFGGVEQLRQAPSFFDGAGLTVNQYFATSADGTKVPYFVVGQRDKPAPTLLYGYGGFEISLTPGYSGGMGRSWLANGGTYVVANARGGGEYGPTWHTSVLKENRFKVYEDFAAVAQDLVDRGITTARQLAFQGGSNGGLTAGVLYTRYPELFGAIVCQVPLLDMKRYSHLLAGASWMAEYGNPDDPTEWGHISKYSPYHNLRDDVAYPPILFTTSTRDDRVHPAHARKMAAKLQSHNQKVYYYENLEGGHGGAADNKQSAHATSLSWEFLLQNL